MNYKERLEKLNDKNDTVWNSIDKPMRRLIFEMNRVGLMTKFCCFGFDYGEDDEPKSHANPHAYVMFWVTKRGIPVVELLKNQFHDNFLEKELQMHRFHDTLHLIIKESRNLSGSDFYQGGSNAIHKYEFYTLMVRALTLFLQDLPGSDVVEIVDGNSLYSEVEFWQIDPKPNFKISTKEFYEKYGKLNDDGDFYHEFIKQHDIVDLKEIGY